MLTFFKRAKDARSHFRASESRPASEPHPFGLFVESRSEKQRLSLRAVLNRPGRLFPRHLPKLSFGFLYWTTIALLVIFPAFVLFTSFDGVESVKKELGLSEKRTESQTESRLSRDFFLRETFPATPAFWGTGIARASELPAFSNPSQDSNHPAFSTQSPNCEAEKGKGKSPEKLEVHHLDDLPPLGTRDPDWLAEMEKIVKASVKDGSWEKRMTEQQAAFLRYADAPKGVRLPMVRESRFMEVETPLATLKRDRARAGASNVLTPTVATALAGFERTYLFLDASVEAQRLFAGELLKRLSPSPIIVMTGGSLSVLRKDLATARVESNQGAFELPPTVYFDQWGRFSAKCQVRFTPTLVNLNTERMTLWTPALTQDGGLLDPVPEAIERQMTKETARS